MISPLTTTLNRIQKCGPCLEEWTKGLDAAGKDTPDDEPISYEAIIDAVGLESALWCCRAEPELDNQWRLFAVWCARQVQHLMTDPRSVKALDVAELHAVGQATDDDLAAAWDAARAATRAAAWDAAGAAAWDAARAATRAAAWDAAGAAAWDAARAAAWDAAGAAARAATRAAAWDAAGAAAWDAARAAAGAAARDAARADQSAVFRQLVTTRTLPTITK
jgi:hypothetical protein